MKYKIAYFGGSFDPPHMGHTKIIQFLAQSPEISKVLVVPTFHNPLKELQSEFPDELRRKLWLHWKEDLAQSLSIEAFQKIEFSLVEFEKASPSFTVDTLAYFQRQYQDSKFILALGEDNLEQLLRWKEPERLAEALSAIWIFPRLHSKIDVQLFPQALRQKCAVRWTAFEVPSISSTQIRQILASKKELPAELLSPEVHRYLSHISDTPRVLK